MSVGDDADPERIMAENESRLKKLATYEVGPEVTYDGTATIKLYLNTASSTTGSGILELETELVD